MGAIEIICILLQAGPKELSFSVPLGQYRNALDAASAEGFAGIVCLLLEAGVGVNARYI